jgi:DNA-binding NtrC family response regulator
MTTFPLPSPANRGVLVASPSRSLREKVLSSLHDRHWPVQEVSGGADALVKLESGGWQLLFLDRRLPDLDAEELVEVIKRRFPGIEVVVLDSDGGPMNPGAMRANWQAKPQLLRFERDPESEIRIGEDLEPLPGMIGRSAAMQHVYKLARLVAPRPTTVLIAGPTGTGKELVARALHRLSPRSAKPFMVVNCAAIPESLLEAELFGYTRGAFTGAIQAYSGRIQAAQGGTLFLDEIGELPLGLQAKLLRFLDQKEIQRLGSSDTLHADVRVVAATNADLELAVEQGTFRGDLYYRLAAFPLHLPSLRERASDIVVLAKHFLLQMAGEIRSAPLQLSAAATGALEAHQWSGNVRELQQVMERAVILAGAGTIQPQHLCFSSLHRKPLFREQVAMPMEP